MKSGTCTGSTPYRSRTSAGPTRSSSLTPRRGSSRVVFALASWKRSRSLVTTSVSPPRSSSAWAAAATKSSAS